LNNAIHYNRPGGEVRLTTSADESAAVVTVSDTGLGISAADLPHIFERFYRGDKSRSSHGGRMGLGLAICKTIIDLHQGSIQVSSEPGVGTQFTVKIPLAPGSCTENTRGRISHVVVSG
jgi:signal transduction histidine kinase